MFDRADQRLVGILIGIGVLLMLCGGIFSFGLGSMVGLGGSTLLGLLLIGAGIYVGLQKATGDPTKYPIQRIDDCKVMNILVTNADGQHVFDRDMFEPEELKFFIQLELPTGRKQEFETAAPVADSMGEGTRGNAMVQGRWLSSFETTGQAHR